MGGVILLHVVASGVVYTCTCRQYYMSLIWLMGEFNCSCRIIVHCWEISQFCCLYCTSVAGSSTIQVSMFPSTIGPVLVSINCELISSLQELYGTLCVMYLSYGDLCHVTLQDVCENICVTTYMKTWCFVPPGTVVVTTLWNIYHMAP